MDLQKAMFISAAGLKVQNTRLRVIYENIANKDSMSAGPDGTPYRRKVVNFQNQLNRELGVRAPVVSKIGYDNSDFGTKYDPGNPAADAKGYVKTTNVNGLIEMMDMSQAQRSYQSNINALEASRKIATMTLELLR